jgi:hypothetical protein
MKNTLLPRRTLPSALALILLPASLQQLQAQTWNSSSSGDWSVPTNWNPGVPANNGTANIGFNLGIFSAATSYTGIDAASWSIDGLNLVGTNDANRTLTIAAGALVSGTAAANTSATLNISAGGITLQGARATGAGDNFFLGASGGNRVHLNLTANQTWNIQRTAGNGETNNHASLRLQGDLSGAGNLVKTGNGLVRFDAGVSTGYTGTVTLDNGTIHLNQATQLDRLGPNALQWHNTAGTTLMLQSGVGSVFAQDINFSDTGAGIYSFVANGPTTSTVNHSIELSGDYSGSLNETVQFSTTDGAGRSNFAWKITGNNSALSSSRTGGFASSASAASSAVFIRNGHVVLGNAHAFGAGNGLSVSIGQNNSNAVGSTAGLYATAGNNVASNIWLSRNDRGGGSTTGSVTLGIDGAGQVNFTGNIGLATTTVSTVNWNNLHLSAGSGARVDFSGQIFDQGSTDTYKSSVVVEGGGVVALSNANNTYGGTNTGAPYGGTSIIGGTTLLANGGATGSSTGSGRVLVGYAEVATTANTTSGSGIVTVASTSGLVVGQFVTGAGLAAGTYIERINVDNTVQLSKAATATGSEVAFTGQSTTGILGGTGRIRPGEANGVVVADGSTVAPGDGIGLLTLDGGATAGTLLSMNSGAVFAFELGAGNASDSMAFWNYNPGDFLLNDNVINFTGAQEGEFTLFTFYGDSGVTLTASGISGGLVVGSGLEGFSYDLIYNADSIVLKVVPEPGVVALFGLGLSVVLFRRRQR